MDIPLDPKMSISDVLQKLNGVVDIEFADLELFKCYSTKPMMKRPAGFPVDVDSEKNLESILEWCKKGVKTIFYRLKSSRNDRTPASSISQLEEQLSEQLEEHVDSSMPSSSPNILSSSSVCVEENIMDTA